jgi:gluconolactonase
MSTRRNLLASAGAALTLGAAGSGRADWRPTQRFPDPAVQIVDPRFERYRIGLAGVERLAAGLNWAEGPAWFGDMRTLLFSDVQNNRIMRWDEETGQTAVFRKPANHSNGLARDRQGRLVVCEHATRRVARTEHDGSTTVLMDGFEGKPLNSPNDIVCKSDGSIWFTDPAFGPNPFEGMARPELPGNVYRIDPETRQATRVVENIRGPNGLGFSPDERVLYVVEARATPNRLILAYDVAADGRTVGNQRVHHDCGRGTADGFKVDVDGNIWCGWGMSEELDGVAVIAPDGKMVGHVRLPERCANVAFGGANRNRLFMASARSIYALYVNTRGA